MSDEWLKWSWRHGGIDVDAYNSLEEAVKFAVHAADYGEESFAFIEGPDGVVDAAEVQRIWDEIERRQDEEYQARPKATHGIKLVAPDGTEAEGRKAWYSTYRDRESADADATALRERFGDRVKVVSIPD